MAEKVELVDLYGDVMDLNGRYFVGRQSLLAAIHQDLVTKPENLLILHGAAGSGKSAVLQQFAAGYLGAHFLPIFADVTQLLKNGLSMFWWEMAQTGAAALQKTDIELPQLAYEKFIAAPFNAFQEDFLTPLLDGANGRIPLFLLDNGDDLQKWFSRTSAAELAASHEQLENWAEFFHLPAIGCILAVSEPVDENSAKVNELLEPGNVHHVSNLGPRECGALLANMGGCFVTDGVAEYALRLTNGSPAALQKLGNVLCEHAGNNFLRVLTIADVVSAYRYAMQNGTKTAVPPFVLHPETQLGQSRKKRVRFAVLLILVSITVIGLMRLVSWQIQLEDSASVVVENRPVVLTSPTKPLATQFANIVASDEPFDKADTVGKTETAVTVPPITATPALDLTISIPDPTRGTPEPELLREADGMPMHFIPRGTFLMGSLDDDFIAGPDERPQRTVTLDGFYIDRFEVSTAQYANFLNDLGAYAQACSGFDCVLPRARAGGTSYLLEETLGGDGVQYIPLTGYANFPINFVSWFGAAAYCESVGGRLPTEAEWEYAARGTDGRIYPWGNQPPGPALALFQTTFSELKPVDALPDGASPFGILGMAGSMWEWTADWYREDQYSQDKSINPTGPETGFARVIRGGGWPENIEADRIRTANRHSLDPDFFSSAVGFRCVYDP